MEPRKLTDEEFYELVNSLRGSSDSLENKVERLFDIEEGLIQEDCLRLDTEIFCCTCCNWWSDQSDRADNGDGEWVCQECFDEQNDD